MDTETGGRRTLVESVSERLRLELPSTSQVALPPFAALAQRFGVSVSTIGKSVRALKQEGLLEGGRGGRVRTRGLPGQVPALPASRSAAERLCARLAEKIHSGVLRSGGWLPKHEALVMEERASKRTVHDAVALLAARGLVHREQRGWRVGAAEHSRSSRRPTNRTIFVVQPRPKSWEGLVRTDVGQFVLAFTREAYAWGVSLEPCTNTSREGSGWSPTAGISEIARKLTAGPSSAIGALVIGAPSDYSDPEGLLTAMAATGRPVVWFDRKRPPERKGMVKGVWECSFVHGGMEQAAMAHLASFGHRHVGYTGLNDTHWVRERRALLEQHAARQVPRISIVGYAEAVGQIQEGGFDSIAPRLRAHAASGPPPVRRALAAATRAFAGSHPDPLHHLAGILARYPPMWHVDLTADRWVESALLPVAQFRGVPRLLPILLSPQVSALVCTRDSEADGMVTCIRALGIGVPEELSMLSFDNSPHYLTLPVTTIERGSESLGYVAFHAILGDIPVPRNPLSGTIQVQAILVDKRSVGPALPSRQYSACRTWN